MATDRDTDERPKPANLQDKYGVNAIDLAVRVRNLDLWQALALLDAVVRCRLKR